MQAQTETKNMNLIKITQTYYLAAAALFFGLLLVACGSGGGDSSNRTGLPNVVLNSIIVDTPNVTVPHGDSPQFTASGYYSDKPTTKVLLSAVVWSISTADQAYATITSSGGKVATIQPTPLGKPVTILANSPDLPTLATASLTILQKAIKTITLSPSNTTEVPLGTAHPFTAIGHYTDGTATDTDNVTLPDFSTKLVAWNSSANNVVSITSPGGIAKGVATSTSGSQITATYGTTPSAATTVTVTAALVQSFTLKLAAPSVANGVATSVTAEAIYTDGVRPVTGLVTWTISNPEVKINASGAVTTKLTTLKTDQVTIIATLPGTATVTGLPIVSAPMTLSITAAVLDTISAQPSQINLVAPGTKQLLATGVMTDVTAYVGSFNWAACNTAAAVINSTGLATAKTTGTCSTTASSSGKTSNAVTVNVNAGTLNGGTIQGSPLTLTTVVSTLAGSGNAGAADGLGSAATFNNPNKITTDGTNLYVAGGGRIRKIEIVSGQVTTLLDATTKLPVSLFGISGITTDGVNLYASGFAVYKIVIATGAVTTLAGAAGQGFLDGPGNTALFNNPNGITLGYNGLLYVADSVNNRIRKVNIATGEVSTLAGSATAGATDALGTAASFNSPQGLTTDGFNVYVADSGNNKIRKVDASGNVSTVAGSGTAAFNDGTGTKASFYYSYDITSDGTNLYVADYANDKIRKIVIATQVVTTIAGNGTGASDGIGSAASFWGPDGITTDGSNLYVSEFYNNKIRKIE